MKIKMTKTKVNLLITLTLLIVVPVGAFIGSKIANYLSELENKAEENTKDVLQEQGPLSSWDLLVLAIAKTESGFDSTAVNGKYKGILQIGTEYVDECNRLVGYNKYTYNDAFSVKKSLEMFELIQSCYNPEHIIDYALKLQNPSGGICYNEKVFRNFRELVKLNEIMKNL